MKIGTSAYRPRASNYWWLMLLTGILLFIIGIWIIYSPLEGYLSLSLAIAFSMVVTGLFELVYAGSNRKRAKGWGWILAGGIIDVFLGGYLLFYPLITMMVLPFVVGLWALFRGIVTIIHAVVIRNAGISAWGWNVFAGLLMILLGVFMVIYPIYGIINIVIWTGLTFITAGAFFIAFSLKAKQA